tara:strand:- start:486 stop:1016 length:531 start_codon:yes stop_codon:yes gene_type:complete
MKKIIIITITFLMFVNCNQTPESTEYLKLHRIYTNPEVQKDLKEGWQYGPLIQMYKGKLLTGEVKYGNEIYFLESGKILKRISYYNGDFDKGPITEVRNYRKREDTEFIEQSGGMWGRPGINMDGEFLTYRSNGDLEMKSFFKNGKLEGERIYYDRNGSISLKESWKKGKMVKTSN